MQHTVDAVTHPQPVGRRLEMNVARARPQRLEDHHVHELDHRRLVGERAQVGDGLLFFGEKHQIAAAEVRCLRVGGRLGLCGEDRCMDFGGGRAHEPHASAIQPA